MFYEHLKIACRNKGTTVTALARKLNVTTANTGHWKNGGFPSVEVLKSMAKELNVSTDYLLGLTEEQKNNFIKNEENNEMEKMELHSKDYEILEFISQSAFTDKRDGGMQRINVIPYEKSAKKRDILSKFSNDEAIEIRLENLKLWRYIDILTSKLQEGIESYCKLKKEGILALSNYKESQKHNMQAQNSTEDTIETNDSTGTDGK